MRTVIISTVYNEEKNIERFLSSIVSQTRLPDEVIVVDGGSSDGTPDLVRKWSDRYPFIRLIVQKCNIAEGRNIAIAASTADIVASTDAGCFVESTWFENIVAPIESRVAKAVTGNFTPTGSLPIQKALAVAGAKRRRPQSNFPSSRSFAFLKVLWEDCKYPEHLLIHEDTKLCRMWAEKGVEFHFASSAVVSWELEKDFSGIFQKYSRYSFWWAYSGDPVDRVRRCIIVFYTVLLGLALIHFATTAMALWGVYWSVRIFRNGGVLQTTRYLRPMGLLMSLPVLLLLDWCSIYGTLKGKLFLLMRPISTQCGGSK
jgi:glycosyltransferase involved in cell wall biosynthesis